MISSLRLFTHKCNSAVTLVGRKQVFLGLEYPFGDIALATNRGSRQEEREQMQTFHAREPEVRQARVNCTPSLEASERRAARLGSRR